MSRLPRTSGVIFSFVAPLIIIPALINSVRRNFLARLGVSNSYGSALHLPATVFVIVKANLSHRTSLLQRKVSSESLNFLRLSCISLAWIWRLILNNCTPKSFIIIFRDSVVVVNSINYFSIAVSFPSDFEYLSCCAFVLPFGGIVVWLWVLFISLVFILLFEVFFSHKNICCKGIFVIAL